MQAEESEQIEEGELDPMLMEQEEGAARGEVSEQERLMGRKWGRGWVGFGYGYPYYGRYGDWYGYPYYGIRYGRRWGWRRW